MKRLILAATFLCLAFAGCKPSAPPGAGSQTVPPASIAFREISAQAGVRFTWPPEPKPLRILEAVGGGCAFLDYDQDGWQDILIVTRPYARLWRNDGKGRFEEATRETGLDRIQGYWRGCAVGDYDGDGSPDVLLTGYRRLALLRNRPTGTPRFADVTKASGLSPDNRGHWGLSAGFMPLGPSGRPDLVITNYVQFGPKDDQYCFLKQGVKSGCPVNHYRPEYPELWENTGAGFRERTASSGLKTAHGRAMTLAFADINGDGRMDFYVGNDGYPAELMINRGNYRFENQGIRSGAAFGPMAHPIAAMGADWADYDRDGLMDLAVSAFADEQYSLLRRTPEGVFEYRSDDAELTGPTYRTLGFGSTFLDFENDGWEDLVFANGHVYDNADEMDPLTTYRQPLQFFHNVAGRAGRVFKDLAAALKLDQPIVGRGSAVGDFDNDGRQDLLILNYEGSVLLLHNESESGNTRLTLDLRGKAPNVFAYGAQIKATSGSQVWVAQVSPARSFLASSDPRPVLGLGKRRTLDTITVRWASGRTQTLHDVKASQALRLSEE